MVEGKIRDGLMASRLKTIAFIGNARINLCVIRIRLHGCFDNGKYITKWKGPDFFFLVWRCELNRRVGT